METNIMGVAILVATVGGLLFPHAAKPLWWGVGIIFVVLIVRAIGYGIAAARETKSRKG